jgi:pimeloyl-ACP methyl ester carboxylesterase
VGLVELNRWTRLRRIVSWGFGIALILGVLGLIYSEWDGRRMQAEDIALYTSRPVACEDGAQFRLPDGRVLGYRITGPDAGEPILYFHGGLGSRLEWPIANEPGFRIIAPDRPGHGCSSPKPDRRIADWAEDIRALAEQLQLERFRIIAWSAGTAHALAVAARMPDRVTRLDLIGVAIPPEMQQAIEGQTFGSRVYRFVIDRAPGVSYRQLAGLRARRAEDPEAFERELAQGLPEPDRLASREPGVREALRRSHGEAMKQAALGVYGDLKALNAGWGFRLEDVKAPAVLWQGIADGYSPPEHAAALARALAQAELRQFEGEGHFLLYAREREILEAR